MLKDVKERYSDKLYREFQDFRGIGVGVDTEEGIRVGQPRIRIFVATERSAALIPDLIEGCRIKKLVGDFVVAPE